MHNSLKVAKWEIKRNLKNKTFVIGLFITPLMIIGFMLLGSFFGGQDFEEAETVVYVNDQLGIFPYLEETVKGTGFPWELVTTGATFEEMEKFLEDEEHTAFIVLDSEGFENGLVQVYTSDTINPFFHNQVQVLESPLIAYHLQRLGLSDTEMAVIGRGFHFDVSAVGTMDTEVSPEGTEASEDMGASELGLERAVPGAFAGFIMLSIVFTGMAIFQSASQEKKDKIAEIILSSLSSGELMQGKIYGYFVLGLVQAAVAMTIVLPVLVWQMDLVPMLEHLFVPELIFFVLIAILGYLLFAALFVGVGATMADMSTAGNFQGMVMMLPFLPFVFIGPVFSDPSGLFAQIGTFIPFTAPGVLLMRLSLMDDWPWIEVIISLFILVLSIWLFMKLAGKIFQVGILMYGKNATPGEIWKWIRS